MNARWLRRGAEVLLGPRAIRRLTLTHAIDDVADALVSLSLVGSLFFSVSFDASRERILLYLALTAAPLAVIAPFVGPALERSRLASRTLLAGTQFARVVLALGLAGSLSSLSFYPLVIGVLLARKVYALAKTILLAQLLPSEADLVAASGHLSRAGTVAGGLGTALAGALLATVGVAALPLLGALGYAVAGAVAMTIPAHRSDDPVRVIAPERIVVPAEVHTASIAVAALRAASGALTLLLALAIKRGGGDAWWFATALVAAGVGGFAGTFLAGGAHRRLSPDRIIVNCLLGPGLVALIGLLANGHFAVLAIAGAIGLAVSVASRAMDVIHARLPDRSRARAISATELRLQLASVAGGSLVVVVAPSPQLGIGAVGAVLVAAAAMFASSRQLALRFDTGRQGAGGTPETGDLARDLLDEAQLALSRDRPRVAIVLAVSAARAAHAAAPGSDRADANAAIDALLQIAARTEGDDHERARRAINVATKLEGLAERGGAATTDVTT